VLVKHSQKKLLQGPHSGIPEALRFVRDAGRVQSVALRLVCERESEIEVFLQQEYWSVTAVLESEQGQKFEARLVQACYFQISPMHTSFGMKLKSAGQI